MVSMGAWALINASAFFLLLKWRKVLRVDEGTEVLGLDAGELGIQNPMLNELKRLRRNESFNSQKVATLSNAYTEVNVNEEFKDNDI
jgi:hypothetical protein